MKKRYLSIMIAGVITMTGCSNKQNVEIRKTNTEPYKMNAKLYLPYDASLHKFVPKIYNRYITYYNGVVRLNDMKLIGFPRRYPKKDFYIDRVYNGIVFISKKRPSPNIDLSKGCYDKETSYIPSVGGALISFGLMPLIEGFPYMVTFERNDKKCMYNAYLTLHDYNISRTALIDKYDQLLKTKQQQQEKLENSKKKTKKILVNYSPIVKERYEDQTGYFHNKKIKYSLIKEVNLPRIDYNYIVEKTFPCNIQECINDFDKTKNIIIKNTEKLIAELNDKNKRLKYLSITFNPNSDSVLKVNNMTFYFTPKFKRKDNKEIDVVYVIKSVDLPYKYPNFVYENHDIKIIENPNGVITISNKTNEFIEILSFSAYLNNKVYNINNNKNKNFINEISPNAEVSFNPFTIDTYLPIDYSGFFEKTNKNKINNTVIKFGFAIKYKKSGSNAINTLYKIKKYKLIDLINL